MLHGGEVCALLAFAFAWQDATPPMRAPGNPHFKKVLFAAIGDYGLASPEEQAVADLVEARSPELVITLGDNNYPLGEASTIDANIGQYYRGFIHPYTGSFGPGASANRFYPSLGNHDWETPGAAPYLAYFALPGNERYYDFVRGPVHFFALDSDGREPDGVTPGSVQGQWLQARLAASTSRFQVVYFHHPPYSSGDHGPDSDLQWPFREWGADLVLAGHDHTYERVVRDGYPYIVNGLGGNVEYAFFDAVACSQVRFNGDHGALFVEAGMKRMDLAFVTHAGIVVDTFTLVHGGLDYDESDLLPAGSVWKFKDDGSDQGTAWRGTGFDDSSWSSGPAQLGYGDGDEATVIASGPPNNHHITSYFRHTFTVADPSLYRAFRIELVRDDGAVVYLNGSQVYRTNMPGGTILFSTPAASAVSGADEDAFWTVDVASSAILAGSNTLAVEVHQSGPTSSDVSFDLRVVGTLDGSVLSPRGATWKYLDDGSNPGAQWATPGFDDSAWASGPAQLGYGEGDEATVVSFGPDPQNRYMTTYLRRSFNVTGAAQIGGLVLALLRDDGTAVYLNGTEIARANVPIGALSPSTAAGFNVSGSDESRFIETCVDPSLLVEGTNWLAVELHQVTPQSSDLSFDLELIGL